MFDARVHQFLAELADNNDKSWFEENRSRYENEVKLPALAFIEAMGPHLAELSTELTAIPKVQGGSMFRIHRDVRFSKDKRPFKTNVGLWFKHLSGKLAPGVYLGIEPDSTGIGAGSFSLEKDQLTAVRRAIVAKPDVWANVRKHLDDAGFELMGRKEALKRAPKGFPADHPHIEDLRLKRFAATRMLPASFVTREDVHSAYIEALVPTLPLMEFLCDAVGVPF